MYQLYDNTLTAIARPLVLIRASVLSGQDHISPVTVTVSPSPLSQPVTGRTFQADFVCVYFSISPAVPN